MHSPDRNALPRLAALIKTNSDVIEAARLFANPSEYSCDEDHVLAAFVPDARSMIKAYYRGSGPKLVETRAGEEALARLDELTCERVARLVKEWRA